MVNKDETVHRKKYTKAKGFPILDTKHWARS